MLLTKKRIKKPKFVEIIGNEIEGVTEFKLLIVINYVEFLIENSKSNLHGAISSKSL